MDHDGEPHKRFICSFPNCFARYNKQWKLDAHMCKHTGVKPFTCDRDSCGKSFCTKYHLERHELTHSGTKPFRCTEDDCAEAFTTNFNLQRHITRTHSQGQGRYACRFEGCGLAFRKNKQLKLHVCEQHAELPPYQCTHEGCQMRFMVPSKLKRHEKVHRGYPCKEGCDFTGKTWTELLKHRKESHGPVFKCEHCSKVFRDMWSLQKHQTVHSDVRVVLTCPRDGCERTFTTIFNLQSHIRSFHDELRPFKCIHEGCNKTFAMKQSLQRHTVVHDPDRKKMKMARPRRSLASRLSGYKPTKKTASRLSPDSLDPPSKPSSASGGCKMSQPATVELILQDTSLLLDPILATNVSSTLYPVIKNCTSQLP